MRASSSRFHRTSSRPLERGSRGAVYSSDIPDPFAVNPVRRSFGLVSTCGLIVFGPMAISGDFAMSVMVSIGWLAVTGLVIGIPILIWSVVEELVQMVLSRLRPTVELLDLSPRVAHILLRHGFETIVEVERASDATLLLLSNMDARGLQEIRRAISLWKYRRWQDEGFPASGYE